MLRLVLALTLSLAMTSVPVAAGATFPARLTDVRGAEIDVGALAARHTLIVVTLKAAGCPVCHEQLRRLAALGGRLRACSATFIVLAPGPADTLRQVAARTGFPYPFVEDLGLAVARDAGLALGSEEMTPAFFHVNARREIVWTQRGRGAGAYGDAELLEYLGCGNAADDRVAGQSRIGEAPPC